MRVGLSYRVPPAAISRDLIAGRACDCCKLPQALPEASSGASPSHHAVLSSRAGENAPEGLLHGRCMAAVTNMNGSGGFVLNAMQGCFQFIFQVRTPREEFIGSRSKLIVRYNSSLYVTTKEPRPSASSWPQTNYHPNIYCIGYHNLSYCCRTPRRGGGQ